MRTAASEHLSNEQIMSRLSATFSALMREEIDIVRTFLDTEEPDLGSHELGPIVELSVRLVERSADWLDIGSVASLARELQESLVRLGNVRPEERETLVAHCRVALEAQDRLAQQLRTEGFAALLAHASSVGDAIDNLRSSLSRAKAQALNASRGVIDEATPDMAPRENLLALTFEIKSSLVSQNDRMGSISEGLGAMLRSVQRVLAEWDQFMKAIDPDRLAPGETASSGRGPAEPSPARRQNVTARAIEVHQTLEEVATGMRSLSHDIHQLLGVQYSLERRARDLDEHLLWEFLDPLDRFVDEIYAAAARRDTAERRSVLTVHTGGVGFEPEIGSMLLPSIYRVLETAESPEGETSRQLRVTAAREGLEARLAIEGRVAFDSESIARLESALEELGGFVTHQGGKPGTSVVHMQFPMARSLRGFLIVEVSGQRIALPWSAIERIHASREELVWSGGGGGARVVPLASLFGPGQADDSPPQPADGPLAILRSGKETGAVGFDRIVWRENARLSPLPPRLYPVEEVLGGIVGVDNQVTLVLHPAAVMRRLRLLGTPDAIGAAAPAAGADA